MVAHLYGMSVYRRSSIPPPLRLLRTEVCASDLQYLDVVRRILSVLHEPAAGAGALAQLVDEMPVLAARLGERLVQHPEATTTTEEELAFLGNRRLEAVLFELLEDLTVLSADQAGIPKTGSVFPPLFEEPKGGR
jgi:hypothetical protein